MGLSQSLDSETGRSIIFVYLVPQHFGGHF